MPIKSGTGLASILTETVAMLLCACLLVMFVQVEPGSGGSRVPSPAETGQRATSSESGSDTTQGRSGSQEPMGLPLSPMQTGSDGFNRIGNFATNSACGGLMAWQDGWTFFVDPSGLGALCAVPDTGGEPVKLLDFPVANVSVMGDLLICTDISATLLIADGPDGGLQARYPDSTGFMRDILDQALDNERIAWGGHLYVLTGVKACMKSGDWSDLTFAPIEMNGGMNYYPVLTEDGIWTSCLRSGMLPLEGFSGGRKPRVVNCATGGTDDLPYHLLQDKGVLQLARVELDPEGGADMPFKSVDFIMQIGDDRTVSTGLSPILITDMGLVVETYQKPASMENGNWQQPKITIVDPKARSKVVEYEGSFPRAYGEDVVFLDGKGQLSRLRKGDPVPERLTDGPAFASFDVLSNGDIAVTYYTDDTREVRQGLLSRNAYDEAYADAGLGAGSRSARQGWYTHMNMLEGMLESADAEIRNNVHVTNADTFLMKKDEQGLWRWYRLSKKPDGTFDFTVQSSMRLPEDRERENEWNLAHGEDADVAGEEESSVDTGENTTSGDSAAGGAASSAEKAEEKAVVPLDNPAMELIYERSIADSSEPCLSQEEMDKLWVLELTGSGSYTVAESGVRDRDAFIDASDETFADDFPSFGSSDLKAIGGVMVDLVPQLVGKTGDIAFATNALPGFAYLDMEGSKTDSVSTRAAVAGQNLTLTLANDAFDLHLTGKEEPDYLILDNQFVYCAADAEGRGHVAVRAHFYHHEDGTIEIRGCIAFVNDRTTEYTIMDFSCDVTESNIS